MLHDYRVIASSHLAMKEKALAEIQPMDTPFRRFRPDDRLLAFLEVTSPHF